MAKFKVRYVHAVEITYDAIVEAETPEEAQQKLEDGDFLSEEEMDYQGISINVQDVEEADEED